MKNIDHHWSCPNQTANLPGAPPELNELANALAEVATDATVFS